VPSLEDLKAGKPEAMALVGSLADCRATGAPVEWPKRGELERAERALVQALKQEGVVVMFNGLTIHQSEHALRVLEVADGAMMDGFGGRGGPAGTRANLALARRAAETGKWVILQDARPTPEAARFSYAAYLLVAAPNVCWGWAREAVEVPEMDVTLGPARGSYRTLPEGEGRPDQVIYHRAFERGDVYLNPQKRTMSIPGGSLPAGSGVVRPRGFADAPG
jgi:hypothetical protein